MMAFLLSCSETVIEAELEKENLVLDRYSPIRPPVDPGTDMEFMRDSFLSQKVAEEF